MESFESMVFGGSYNKHQAKCYKKNKCKRMIRILGKRPTPKDYGSGTDVVMFLGGGDEENDEESEKKKELQRERAERNKKWRERRDRERNGNAEDLTARDVKVDKEGRNNRIQDELTCSNCREKLEGEVWQCNNGHSTCGECFDKEKFLEMCQINEDQLMIQDIGLQSLRQTLIGTTRTESGISSSKKSWADSVEKDDTLWKYKKKFFEDDTLSSDSSVLLEEGSYIRPPFNKIDFEANTLDIRKDVIREYEDYNAYLHEEDDEEDDINFKFPTGDKDSDDEGTFVSGDTTLPDYEESVMEMQLHPKTLSQIILEDSHQEEREKEEEEKKTKRLMKYIKKMDFFKNTLNIRKDAIEIYKYKTDPDSNEKTEEGDEDDDDASTIIDGEDDDESKSTVKLLNCSLCEEPIEERNNSLEKLVTLFNNMMMYRNKI